MTSTKTLVRVPAIALIVSCAAAGCGEPRKHSSSGGEGGDSSTGSQAASSTGTVAPTTPCTMTISGDVEAQFDCEAYGANGGSYGSRLDFMGPNTPGAGGRLLEILKMGDVEVKTYTFTDFTDGIPLFIGTDGNYTGSPGSATITVTEVVPTGFSSPSDGVVLEVHGTATCPLGNMDKTKTVTMTVDF